MYQGISADRLSSDPEPVKRSGMFFSCRIHSLDAKTFYLCNVTNFRKLIFFAVLAIVRNGMAAPPDTNIDSLIEYAAAQSRKGNFEEVVAAAGRLRALGRMGDDKARLYGLIYTGHVLAREVNDSVKLYYGRARDLALAAKDYRALTAIDNALAIYTSEMEMNYLGGLSYFMEALKYAELSPDKQAYPVVLNNIAMAHYLRNDPNGLKYSLQVVDIGTANGDPLLLYSGSFVTAYMYYLQGDPATALRYIETALAVGGNYIEYAEAYSLYANILAGLGRKSEAERYYKRAVAHVGSEKSNTLAYLNYGSYLMANGSVDRATSVLEKGLEFVNKRNNAFYRYQLYEKLSEAYELAGRPQRALDYYKKYHAEFDSIFNIGRERAINELRVQYESEKQEKELRGKELDLLRERQKLNITIFTVAVLVGLLAALFIAYRRKNQRYRQIVRQQHELIQKEKTIKELYSQSEGGRKYTVSSLSDEKGQALFSEFEKLMRTEKIYRRSDITVDKIADRLETNRTYLSRAINENSGMSFSQYINSCRIDEARHILSETDNDIQIKALAYELGFATPETFSATFKRSIGMLPTKFRKEMRRMYNDAQETN